MLPTITMPSGQFFIQPANQYGYQLEPDGNCYGVSSTGLVEFLDNNLDAVDTAFISFAVLLQLGITLDIKQPFISKLDQNMQHFIRNTQLSILAILDSIFVYQRYNQDGLHKSLYELQHYPQTQRELDKSAHLALPKTLQKRGGIAQIGTPFTVQLTIDQSTTFFQDLEKELTTINVPVGFILINKNHAILVAWHPKDKFIFLDANALPSKKNLPPNTVSTYLQNSLTENEITTFSAYCYTVQDQTVHCEKLAHFIAQTECSTLEKIQACNHYLDLPDAYNLFAVAAYPDKLISNAIQQKFPKLFTMLNQIRALEIELEKQNKKIIE